MILISLVCQGCMLSASSLRAQTAEGLKRHGGAFSVRYVALGKLNRSTNAPTLRAWMEGRDAAHTCGTVLSKLALHKTNAKSNEPFVMACWFADMQLRSERDIVALAVGNGREVLPPAVLEQLRGLLVEIDASLRYLAPSARAGKRMAEEAAKRKQGKD